MHAELLAQCRARITRYWRRQIVMAALALVAPLCVVIAALGWDIEALVVMACACLAGIGLARLTRPCVESVVGMMNRQLPELEYSARLLLQGGETASFLSQMQRARVRDRLARIADQIHQHIALPRLARTDRAATAGLLLAAPLAAVAFTVGLPIRTAVLVTPPAYTGITEYSQDSLRVEAPQGSNIRISVRSKAPATVAGLEARRVEERHVTHIAFTARDSTLFEVQPAGQGALTVIPDRAPTIILETPEEREFAPDAIPLIVVDGSVRDDYGISQVNALATVARGDGEAVKFRDVRLPVELQDGRISGQWRANAFDLEPGDELYLRLEAMDNRTPEPQRAVSQAAVFRWLSEEITPAGSIEGIIVDRLPEYFRSQRQIIIDTESLMEKAPDLHEEEVLLQSQQIAFDQRNLRLRYGQYLGEEATSDIGPSAVMSAQENHDEDHDNDNDHGDDHGNRHDGAHAEHGPERSAGSADFPAFMEAFVHSHDSFLTNTMFDTETREILITALNAMWKAEMELGLGEPAAALPWEYEALTHLKRVQQAGRIYVKRVGFEPPPLNETKRLSGELDEARSTRVSVTFESESGTQRLRAWMRAIVEDDAVQAEAFAREVAQDSAMPVELRNAAVDFAAAASSERGAVLQMLRENLSTPLVAPPRREAR